MPLATRENLQAGIQAEIIQRRIVNEEKENTVEKSQSFTWIEYPRLGTSLSSGRWMASIEIGTTLKTDVLELDAGQWYWPDGSRLGDRETVVAVAQVPAPYRPEHDTQPERAPTRPARSKP